MLPERLRRSELGIEGGRPAAGYRTWLLVMRYLVPLAVVAVFLHTIGVF